MKAKSILDEVREESRMEYGVAWSAGEETTGGGQNRYKIVREKGKQGEKSQLTVEKIG